MHVLIVTLLSVTAIVIGQSQEDKTVAPIQGRRAARILFEDSSISSTTNLPTLPKSHNVTFNYTDVLPPTNETEGRTFHIDLENLKIGTRKQNSNRQGRIINENKKKHKVTGFIPLVTLDDFDKSDEDKQDSTHDYPLYDSEKGNYHKNSWIGTLGDNYQKESKLLGSSTFQKHLGTNDKVNLDYERDEFPPIYPGSNANQQKNPVYPGSHISHQQNPIYQEHIKDPLYQDQIKNPVYQDTLKLPDSSAQPVFPSSSIQKPSAKYVQNIGGIGLLGDVDGLKGKCVCVPFYLCKNGVLEDYGRKYEPVDERSARSDADVYFDQSNHTKKFEETALVRIINEQPNKTKFHGKLDDYASEIMERVLGLPDEGCGSFRVCCAVPPIISPVGSFPQIYPPHLPHPNPHNIHHKPIEKPLPFPLPIGGAHFPKPGVAEGILGGAHFPKPGVAEGILGGAHFPKPGIAEGILGGAHFPKPGIAQGILGGAHFPNPNIGLPKPHPIYPPFGLHHGKCGLRKAVGVQGRVNNLQYYDDSAEFGEYPWHVAILKKTSPSENLYICGGTLIAPQWIATAAHCLKNHHPQELVIRLGEWDVHRGDEFYPYVEKYVAKILVHPEYYPGNFFNDIALLKMDYPVDPKLPHITPACLPEPHELFIGQRCWVTGWGKSAFGHQGQYQSVLKEVDIPVLSHKDCEHRLTKTRLGPHYRLFPGFVCAGGEPGKDACTGDGGSPMVCEVHGIWKVVGLVSWGIGCGLPGIPGVYVNMAYYRPWMEEIFHKFG